MGIYYIQELSKWISFRAMAKFLLIIANIASIWARQLNFVEGPKIAVPLKL